MYYASVAGRDVWVIVDRPMVRQPNGGYSTQGRYIAAFRFDEKPALVVGEYLRDAGGLRWFDSEEEAADAAFEEAARRIAASR